MADPSLVPLAALTGAPEQEGPPCHLCSGLCCRSITILIPTPTNHKGLDKVRWYVAHKGVTLSIEGGEWYLEIETVCSHLQPDNRCGIYEDRPDICRDYAMEPDDLCEYFTDETDYAFETAEAFHAWMKRKADRADRREQAAS